ncbi:N-acetyltransferase family protein [Streptococcus dentapri]|uniref:GNAT family N-acetyltransferase n=1 Tax=Streptococcus dentapri TaxID=573564 RepID=A0ABV8D144_9STRE
MTSIIRLARLEDAEELLAIYTPYVKDTAISFEYQAPSLEDFRQRMQTINQTYPYLVAEINGELVGYAYACTFHQREAYQWLAELAIYLAPHAQGLGLGRLFYEHLENCLTAQGVLAALACIATTEEPDAYLNNNSQEFHEHLGYHVVGHFKEAGFKFGHWYDMKWLKKKLADNPEHPQPILPFYKTDLYQSYYNKTRF